MVRRYERKILLAGCGADRDRRQVVSIPEYGGLSGKDDYQKRSKEVQKQRREEEMHRKERRAQLLPKGVWPSRWDLRGQGAGSPRRLCSAGCALPSWTLGVALVLE